MRISKPGNSIYFEISVWYEEKTESIQIASNDAPKIRTSVRADARLKRGHPNLFEKLAKLLRDNGVSAPPEEPRDA